MATPSGVTENAVRSGPQASIASDSSCELTVRGPRRIHQGLGPSAAVGDGDDLEDSRSAAEAALASADDGATGLDALAGYVHAVLDLRVSAVVPLALDRLDLDDPELRAVRESSAAAVERLLQAAHADGSLPSQITFADIGTLPVRLSRPLPGPVPLPLNDTPAHRHLDLVLAGLRSDPAVLTERGLSRQELRAVRPRQPPAT